MIFKLLIVDDEATVRKGIARFMNWSSIDCEVAGTASDGLEAIAFLQQTPVDIVITDIKMPEADGLEVARYVYEHSPSTRVILLTGYADFEYARTAIRYNVASFLLKPINKKALFEAVQEAQTSILSHRRTSAGREEELAFLRDQLLQELTDQPCTDSQRERLAQLQICLDCYCIAAFQTSSGEAVEHKASLRAIICEECKQAYCFRYNGLIMAVYPLSKQALLPGQPPQSVLESCREIAAIAETLSVIQVHAGVSQIHTGAEAFGDSVAEAIGALSLHFYSEDRISLFSADSPSPVSSLGLTAESSAALLQFENSLNSWDFADALSILDNMFVKFKSNFVHSMDVKNICVQIYYLCSRVLMKRNLDAPPISLITQINEATDIFTLKQTARLLVQTACDSLSNSAGSVSRLWEQATKYIRLHLAEPLSLESIADNLHVSSSYLSRTFKKSSGESLTEYINKARIQKAQEYLAHTDSLTYEVAEKVGYHDSTYFSSIFKKYTGQSPTEYRRQMQKSVT